MAVDGNNNRFNIHRAFNFQHQRSRYKTQNPPDRMKAKNIRKPLDLPPEIIDIIVHEIALSQDLIREETLKACSLVSKSFCFPCRRHLFSDLKLVSDKFSESRAARLIKILQNPDSSISLAACVRSLTLILDASSSSAHRFIGSKTLGRWLHKSKVIALTVAARLHLYESNLVKALSLLMQTPLESFTLHTQGAVKAWETQAGVARRMKNAIHIASAASLTTLHLSNLINVDESLIARAVHSNTLKELALTRVTLRVRDEDANLNLQPTTSQIERLDFKHISCKQVLRIMGRPTIPSSTPYPLITFPRLRHLIIPGPWSDLEMETVWEFMLGVADTLETLEIEENKWGGNVFVYLFSTEGKNIQFYFQDSVHLEQLTSLRSLKIITNALDAHGSFNRKLSKTCQLLSPAATSTPVKIQSLTIQFNVQVLPETNFYHAQALPSWLELDDILTGGSYAHLRQVDLGLHFFFVVAASAVPAGWRPQINIDPNHILSRLSTHPFIDFRLNIRNFFTPHPMAVYLYSP